MQPAAPQFLPGNTATRPGGTGDASVGPGGTGEVGPTLVVIRGNSGSGKTTAAREVRRRYGRGCALIEQDHLRRVVLREHDRGEPVAPSFIAATTRAALELGYHVVLEGILVRKRYADALGELLAGHRGPSHVFYFDLPLEVTMRRNRERLATEGFTAEDMREWYAERDVLGVPGEVVLGEVTPEQAADTILHRSGLAEAAALTPCPTRCPRCHDQAGQR